MPAHFTQETFRFLRGLARHNERPWFEERRETYESALRQPLHSLIDDINAGLAAFAPEHIRPAHKVAMRIYRDTRFSPDKRPYKTHLSAWWSRHGFEKRSAAGFYLQLGPTGGFIAAGLYAPAPADLLALRRWLATHHVRLRATLTPLLAPAGQLPAMTPIEPNALTRAPKGFPADHPALDLLRARNLGVSAPLTPAGILSPTLAALVLAQLRRAAPLVNELNEAFLPASKALPS